MILFNALLCGCPPAAAITSLPLVQCPSEFGQVVRLIFQRNKQVNGTQNSVTVVNAALLATWVASKALTDGEKTQASPEIGNPEFTAGEARVFGGGNATVGGIEIVLGSDPSTFTSVIYRARQDIISVLKEYACEDMGVYLVNGDGQIAGDADDVATPTLIKPFSIRSLFVGDKLPGGFEAPDQNALNFSLLPNWSDNFHAVTTAFDPQTNQTI